MHLKENCNLEDFLNKVKECRSKVTFETSEGDILAMQSALCQLIFVSLQHQPELLYSGEICCEDKNDYEILKDYLI